MAQNAGRFTQKFFALRGISNVHQAAVIAQRGRYQHVIRPVDLLAKFEGGSIIGFRSGAVAHGLIEDRTMVQQLDVNGMRLAQRALQQRRGFVVELLGRLIVPNFHFEIGGTHQAGSVNGMRGANGLAQNIQRGGEIIFGLAVLAQAMVVAGEIDQQRSILRRRRILGIDVGFVNGARSFKCRGRFLVFALAAVNGSQRFERFGHQRIVRAQHSRANGHGLFRKSLRFGKAASVTAKEREIVGAVGIVY